MTNLDDYLEKRGITEAQMAEARERTNAYIEAYNLQEACKASHTTQVDSSRATDPFCGHASCETAMHEKAEGTL